MLGVNTTTTKEIVAKEIGRKLCVRSTPQQ